MIFIPMKYTPTFCKNLVHWGLFIPLDISNETKHFIFTPQIFLSWFLINFYIRPNKTLIFSKPTKRQCYRNMFMTQISPLIPQKPTLVGTFRRSSPRVASIMDDWSTIPQSDACCTDAENIINSLYSVKTLDDLNFMFKFAMVFRQSDPESVFNIYNEYCRAFKSIFKQVN